jgi:hypothetical protein
MIPWRGTIGNSNNLKDHRGSMTSTCTCVTICKKAPHTLGIYKKGVYTPLTASMQKLKEICKYAKYKESLVFIPR